MQRDTNNYDDEPMREGTGYDPMLEGVGAVVIMVAAFVCAVTLIAATVAGTLCGRQ